MGKDWYEVLNSIMKEEIDEKQTIAIYPLGRIGLYAKYILENRYGIEGIVIDNNLARCNSKIISVEKFKEMDKPNITIILCALDMHLNDVLTTELKKHKMKARIRNILEPLVAFHQEKKDYFVQIKELCRVKEAIGHNLVRIGSQNDGGYVMLDDFQECDTAYSFGIGEEISWDEEMANRGIEVYCYDHTIEYLPKENDKLHFNKIGISDTDCVQRPLLTMSSILHRNAHDKKDNLILKMDVEGAEWEFINSVSTEVLKQFSQMTFELHNLTSMENKDQVIAALKKINITHQPVWIHANNVGGAETAGNNIVIPRLMEITYTNREKYEFKLTEYTCPLDIDMPNLKEYFDIKLINWGGI